MFTTLNINEEQRRANSAAVQYGGAAGALYNSVRNEDAYNG